MKRRKFFWLFALFVTLCCSAMILAGCATAKNPQGDGGDTGEEDPPETRAYSIVLNEDEVDLLVGDEFTLTAELYLGSEKIEDATFMWESLQTECVTVDANGKLTAVAEGTAQIKVSAVGHEDVDAYADVTVRTDLTLDLSETEVLLGKVAVFGYEDSAEISYEVKQSGTLVPDAQVTLSVSTESVTAEVADGKIVISAQEVGEAVVTAKYTSGTSEVSTTISVEVIKPFLDSGETYLFSAGKRNTIDLSQMEATKELSAEEIVKVTSAGNEFPVTGKSGSVITISETEALGEEGEESLVMLEFGDYAVQVTLKSYTLVIRTIDDFLDMENYLEDVDVSGTACKVIHGYFILADDLDFNEYYEKYNTTFFSSPFSYKAVGDQSGGFTHGWDATFDGAGHQIKNLVIGKYDGQTDPWINSLFGTITGTNASNGMKGGVVKNVAFVNASLAEGQGLKDSAFLANFVYGTIENVYVDIAYPENSSTGTQNSYSNDVFACNVTYAKISNVTIIVRSQFDTAAKNPDDVWDRKSTPDSVKSAIGPMLIVGGGAESLFVTGYNTVADIQAVNSLISAYASTEAFGENKGTAECGSAKASYSDGVFTVTWNGEVVYTYPEGGTTPSEPEEYSIRLNAEDMQMVVGEEYTLTAELYLGSEKVENATFAWESLNTEFVTVDNSGKLTAVAEGTAQIKVSAVGHEGVEATIGVTVVEMKLELSETQLELGTAAKFDYVNTAEVSFAVKEGSSAAADAQVSVSVSNENVTAEIVEGKIVITAQEIGESVVTVKGTVGTEEVTATISVKVVKPVLESGETYLFSAGNRNTIDLSTMDATKDLPAADVQKVTFGDNEFPITTKEGSVITLSQTEALGEEGATNAVTLDFGDYAVQITLKSYTLVIRTIDDFLDMASFLEDTTKAGKTDSGFCKVIHGYFILDADLDFNEYYEKYNTTFFSSPFSYKAVGDQSGGFTHGWDATFDGAGHQIKNLVIGKYDGQTDPWINSLFGTITGTNASNGMKGGVVKNVAFVNASLAEGQGLKDSAFLANFVYGTIENVYVDIAYPENSSTGTQNSYSNDVFACNVTYAKISNVTIIVRSQFDTAVKNKDDVWDTKNTSGAVSSVSGSMLIVGGGAESLFVTGYNTAADIHTANEAISAYASVDAFAQAATTATCGSASVSVSENTFTVTWNGQVVYTAAVGA